MSTGPCDATDARTRGVSLVAGPRCFLTCGWLSVDPSRRNCLERQERDAAETMFKVLKTCRTRAGWRELKSGEVTLPAAIRNQPQQAWPRPLSPDWFSGGKKTPIKWDYRHFLITSQNIREGCGCRLTGRPTFSGHLVALSDVANYWVGHLQARRGTALLRTQGGGCVGLGRYINMFIYMSGIFGLLVLHRLQSNLLYEMVEPLQ